MKKQDRYTLLLLLGVLGLSGWGLSHFQDYLNDDWTRISQCPQSYWSCESEVLGDSRRIGGSPVHFAGAARACEQYSAFLAAGRRAEFECAISRRVVGGTCRELDTHCRAGTSLY